MNLIPAKHNISDESDTRPNINGFVFPTLIDKEKI